MSYRVLLVEPDEQVSADIERVLSEAGYRSTYVATFEEASRQLALDCPDLLITSIRLGRFNGLHLMLRHRSDYPDMPVVVTGGREDLALTAETVQHGARFLMKPVEAGPLLSVVSELLAGRAPRDPLSTRRWPRKHTELRAEVADATARVVDVSYGGLRLEFDDEPDTVEDQMDVDLPSLGMSIKALPRWTRPSDQGRSWWCGVELAPDDYRAMEAWRVVVDSLN